MFPDISSAGYPKHRIVRIAGFGRARVFEEGLLSTTPIRLPIVFHPWGGGYFLLVSRGGN